MIEQFARVVERVLMYRGARWLIDAVHGAWRRR